MTSLTKGTGHRQGDHKGWGRSMCLTPMGEGDLQTYVTSKPINKNENQIHLSLCLLSWLWRITELESTSKTSWSTVMWETKLYGPMPEASLWEAIWNKSWDIFYHEHPIEQGAQLIKLPQMPLPTSCPAMGFTDLYSWSSFPLPILANLFLEKFSPKFTKILMAL